MLTATNASVSASFAQITHLLKADWLCSCQRGSALDVPLITLYATAWETLQACALEVDNAMLMNVWSHVKFIIEWDKGLLDRLVWLYVGIFTFLNFNAKNLYLLCHQRIVSKLSQAKEKKKIAFQEFMFRCTHTWERKHTDARHTQNVPYQRSDSA